MAIVKLGTTVIGIRGTIGGITYSSNAAGPYAKLWSRGPNPRSTLQAQTRGRISTIPGLWFLMDESLRQDWRDFAADPPELDYNSLGERIYLSGYAWLVRVNQRLKSCGLPLTTTVPDNSLPDPPASVTLTCSPLPVGPCSVEWPLPTYPSGTSAMLELAVHPTPGLLTKHSGFKLLFTEHEPSGTSADVTAQASSRFGNLPADWKIFASLYVLRDDGIRSLPAVTTAVIA
jgi:hypothetical protein